MYGSQVSLEAALQVEDRFTLATWEAIHAEVHLVHVVDIVRLLRELSVAFGANKADVVMDGTFVPVDVRLARESVATNVAHVDGDARSVVDIMLRGQVALAIVLTFEDLLAEVARKRAGGGCWLLCRRHKWVGLCPTGQLHL
mmetsp:Transcript_9276/g.27920  ORF Transcript_9276/g.27920 Transcript_9276/m.27920 type:complete len:142 (-) Transcript_9276:911-1336(-)